MSEHAVTLLIKGARAGVTLLIGWLIITLVLRFEKKVLERSRLDSSLHLFICRATQVLLWVVVIMAVLPELGINTASMVTVIGACGAAIALALKDSLGNVAGGIILLVNKPFSRGDLIDVAGTSGIVDSIDLLTTSLHTFDNKIVTIPNGTITTSVITNFSSQENRRVDCTFTIGYEADIRQAREVLENVILCCDMILREPEPLIGVASHGEHGILLDLKVWCSTSDYFDVKYYLEENVKIAFDEAGISIPYPQVDVHIVK